ncbi:MAG: cob(I)yrinic acid a,c-diamide adenosyltransferase [Thaumarchaeota archaeon]|nr:MAG: cob(I)yrinic acid a,c-diamide adenosyltransferase [Nitrososphaerota archaeon]
MKIKERSPHKLCGRIMARYGRGDRGETILRSGLKVWKDDERVEICGIIDELSSIIGVARSMIDRDEISKILLKIQEHLFLIGAEISSLKDEDHIEEIKEEHLKFLEENVERYESRLPKLSGFIYPGGTVAASILHFARAVARRAERRLISLSRRFRVNSVTMAYLNRLSTLLYVLARYLNYRDGVEEPVWRRS